MLGGIFRRQLHVSYLIAGLCLGICLGLVLAKLVGLAVGWDWLVVGLTLSLAAFRNRRLMAVALVLLAGILVGGQRGSAYLQAASGYYQFIDHGPVVITAVVSDDPEVATDNLTQINLKDVSINGQSLPGQVYATVLDATRVKRGDRLRLKSELDDGFGSFQAVARRAGIDRISRSADAIRDVRDNFA
ncbi:MAG TPA: DUF4131 domain-containing protein, partial [Candidatus Saccharimonadales bacterium]|nr:DUF4131 domain-containing protein [Candidatus Saccharimonadales bacterium]